MRYEQELVVVIHAVREAGDALRNELHRVGGPRGQGEYAEIDTRVEMFLRESLPHLPDSRALLPGPTWCFRGEETGTFLGDDLSHQWLVDPNDGTASFLKRRRGAAISVGLVRDGRPVLGVVYAYAFPDDDGDLIAWAEGQPLTRNGVALSVSLADRELNGRSLVLLSQDADTRPMQNGVLAYPARYAAVPSIAYRLALVAAGEADAAVSLAEPEVWDYAAGHALLLGAGGTLVDQAGQEISYREASHSVVACFGGAPHVVQVLSGRDWSVARAGRKTEHLPFELSSLAARKGLERGAALTRAQGCLLGQLAGDSLGSLVEFRDAMDILGSYPDGVRDLADGGTFNTLAGQPTDDSEMALVLARGILRMGKYDPSVALDGYVYWYESNPFDMGGTTAASLGPSRHARSGADRLATAARCAKIGSQANGSLMRSSPLGIFGAFFRGDIGELAAQDSALTHPNAVCRVACEAFVVAIAGAIRDGLSPRQTYELALQRASASGESLSVRDRLIAASTSPPSEFLSKEGWVLVALQNAFYQLLHAPTLEAGVIDTVMRGGDTDTNAAIAGALLGAVHGREAVPARWRRALWSCRPQLLPGLDDPPHVRPSTFWPVDALEIAEALLVAGAEAHA